MDIKATGKLDKKRLTFKDFASKTAHLLDSLLEKCKAEFRLHRKQQVFPNHYWQQYVKRRLNNFTIGELRKKGENESGEDSDRDNPFTSSDSSVSSGDASDDESVASSRVSKRREEKKKDNGKKGRR